jgi:hypothetical protein
MFPSWGQVPLATVLAMLERRPDLASVQHVMKVSAEIRTTLRSVLGTSTHLEKEALLVIMRENATSMTKLSLVAPAT